MFIGIGLMVATPLLDMACATDAGGRRDDDDYDLDRPRRRRRRRRPPNLISKIASRLPEAEVERSRRGRPRTDLEKLRETFCDGRVGAKVIFYQLVVSNEWHYYWLCSTRKVKRAVTPKGARLFRAWLARITRRARRDALECSPGSTRRLFSVRHRSGTRARAYCDGLLMLRYPDGGKHSFPFRRGSRGGATAAGGTQNCPVCKTCPTVAGQTCPVCKTCPTCQTCKRCPAPKPCPPQKVCLAPNTKATCKVYGEKAFWLGVGQACKRICPAIYKWCHKKFPNTALCNMARDYCENLQGVCKR